MLRELTIQGLAIIDTLSIDFSNGFNVITGETGAGKSILIRALNFLMGAKASADTVRQGYAQATVTGEFTMPKGHPAIAVMEELGIPTEETAEGYPLLIRRTLTAKGRSQSWVNDVVVTAGPLRSLGNTLVDVFGQHENQRLMDEVQHVAYVDDFLSKRGAKLEVERLSRECSGLVMDVQRMLSAFQSSSQNRDYL